MGARRSRRRKRYLGPFSIVRLADGVAWVALTVDGAISVFRVEKGTSTQLGHIPTPFGAYDVVFTGGGNGPIALAPGQNIENACDRDGFVVRLLRTTGPGFEIEGHVPPSNVVTRPLTSGFFVGWLAPVSCKQQGRDMVRAFLVSADGAPASSTMAVAEATGFAVSAHADAVDLWVSTRDALLWVKARCALRSVLP